MKKQSSKISRKQESIHEQKSAFVKTYANPEDELDDFIGILSKITKAFELDSLPKRSNAQAPPKPLPSDDNLYRLMALRNVLLSKKETVLRENWQILQVEQDKFNHGPS
jgi:hypothetical protein